MVPRLKRRTTLQRKLHILRTLTCSKSVKKSCIIADAVLYIHNLKLQLDKIRRELSNPKFLRFCFIRLHYFHREVKVEKSNEGFVVKIKCENDGDKLMVMLEVFEEMGLMVLNASVSTEFYFDMEAIVVPQQGPINVSVIAQAILCKV